MTPAERGFLLLTSPLGNPQRPVLTVAQFRTLALRVSGAPHNPEQRNLTPEDILALGYQNAMAYRICNLLSEGELLDYYLRRSIQAQCQVRTRISRGYPLVVRKRLGLDCPASLWGKGKLELLDCPKIALVGSRDIDPENQSFAEEVGRQAALQGKVLVSGNARGADQIAQNACLASGGSVISVVADCLTDKNMRDRILYLSEDGFNLPFTAQRALSRNRVIHVLADTVIVAQCSLKSGGSWDGSTKNLRYGWSHVCCFQDGSQASRELEQMGADSVGLEDLKNLDHLPQHEHGFYDL